jgi:hypothetical protein
MSLFAPIFQTEGFETTGYWDICHQIGSRELVDAALSEGVLAAHVQVDGEDPRQFYKVPRDHWRGLNAFMEGEPGEELFCWGSSDVPIKLRDRPLVFFMPEVERWMRTLHREPMVEIAGSTGLDEDAAALDDCLNRASMPSEGYWSVFATLAWIVSRQERFVAATQLFEVERHAERGVFCAFAWHALGNKAGELFGQTFSDSESVLREALQANRLTGGTAIETCSGESVLIERHQWRLWRRVFETRWGTLLLPGFHDFAWPSEMVRLAFPASDLRHGSSPRASLPDAAKPKHRKYEPFAHRAAEIVRAEGCLRSAAIRKALDELGTDSVVQRESVERGVRDTYDLMYGNEGTPRPN